MGRVAGSPPSTFSSAISKREVKFAVELSSGLELTFSKSSSDNSSRCFRNSDQSPCSPTRSGKRGGEEESMEGNQCGEKGGEGGIGNCVRQDSRLTRTPAPR